VVKTSWYGAKSEQQKSYIKYNGQRGEPSGIQAVKPVPRDEVIYFEESLLEKFNGWVSSNRDVIVWGFVTAFIVASYVCVVVNVSQS